MRESFIRLYKTFTSRQRGPDRIRSLGRHNSTTTALGMAATPDMGAIGRNYLCIVSVHSSSGLGCFRYDSWLGHDGLITCLYSRVTF